MSAELDEFHGEAREILEGVATDLVRLEKSPRDADLVNRIFRGAHSLKGLAGMLGFTGIAQAAHKLESVLDAVRMGRVPVTSEVLDVLLEAVEVVGRMVDVLKEGEPDRENGAWAVVAERLSAIGGAKPGSAGGPKRSIDPEIARILSEYEEHRLSSALAAGHKPWRIDVQFAFDTFDTDLPALKERIKPYGEVITTMAGDLSAADKMGFGLLVVSQKDPSVLVVAAAIPNARITPVSVVDLAPVSSMTPPAGADGGGTFEGFSAAGNLSGWGVAELPPTTSASMLAATEIDWNALSKEGEALPAPGGAVFDFRTMPAASEPVETEEDRRERAPDRRANDRRQNDRRITDTRVAPIPDAVPGAGAGTGAATLRVNLDRIDALMNLVGELVTAKNAIAAIAEKMKVEHGFKGTTLDIFKAKRILERRLDELQKGIMQVRMLPMDGLFAKLQRVVRNLSRESGKEVELVVDGADTELDKVMIDELSDPLIHIVRNSVDHGIEPLGERLSQGKPPRGQIRITAAPKGNHVAIEIQDDGGGLDAERIRAKGIEKGLLSPEAQPTEEELFDLIFAPGFSTKEVVSEVSGRGVGMDVVRNNIMKLNGIIDTQSERGKGTRFTITLPLTLATMKALVVGVYGQTYAIPLASVLECVSPKASDLKTVEGREVLPLRESTLPLIRLEKFFRLRDEDDGDLLPELDANAPRLHVVVVGLAQYRIGLVVDTLGAQQDVVVKPLGAPLTAVGGIMGATNLGNNRAVLVLDVAGVVNSAVGMTRAPENLR